MAEIAPAGGGGGANRTFLLIVGLLAVLIFFGLLALAAWFLLPELLKPGGMQLPTVTPFTIKVGALGWVLDGWVVLSVALVGFAAGLLSMAMSAWRKQKTTFLRKVAQFVIVTIVVTLLTTLLALRNGVLIISAPPLSGVNGLVVLVALLLSLAFGGLLYFSRRANLNWQAAIFVAVVTFFLLLV